MPSNQTTTIQTTHYLPHPGATRTIVTPGSTRTVVTPGTTRTIVTPIAPAGNVPPVISTTTTMTSAGESVPASATTTVNTEEVPMSPNEEPQDELIIETKKVRKPKGKRNKQRTEAGQSGGMSESDPGQPSHAEFGLPAVPGEPPASAAPESSIAPGLASPEPTSPLGSGQEEEEFEEDEEAEGEGQGRRGGRGRFGRPGHRGRRSRGFGLSRAKMEHEDKQQDEKLQQQSNNLFNERLHPGAGAGIGRDAFERHPELVHAVPGQQGPGHFPGPHHGPSHNAHGR